MFGDVLLDVSAGRPLVVEEDGPSIRLRVGACHLPVVAGCLPACLGDPSGQPPRDLTRLLEAEGVGPDEVDSRWRREAPEPVNEMGGHDISNEAEATQANLASGTHPARSHAVVLDLTHQSPKRIGTRLARLIGVPEPDEVVGIAGSGSYGRSTSDREQPA